MGGSMTPEGQAAAMEVLSLFPRYLLKGHLPEALLDDLLRLARQVAANPEGSPNAAAKLAGQLFQQRELGPDQPAVRELCAAVILPACERWIRHVIDKQPPQGRGGPGPGGIAPIDQQQQGQRRLARLGPPGPQQLGGRLIEAPGQRPQGAGASLWGWRTCQPAAMQGANHIWGSALYRDMPYLGSGPGLSLPGAGAAG